MKSAEIVADMLKLISKIRQFEKDHQVATVRVTNPQNNVHFIRFNKQSA